MNSRDRPTRDVLTEMVADTGEEGPPVVLEKLSQTSASNSLPEVLSFAQEWRAGEDSNLRPAV
jgi:hypothetical protein